MTDKNKIDNLLSSAGQGELEKIIALLESGLDINSVNDIGYTALMSAARSYRTTIVAYLLEHGANSGLSCADGVTALHAAVGETPSQPDSQSECVKMLINAGADLNATTSTGLTPLMNAAWFGCTQSFKVLIDAGASVGIKDSQGRTAEDLAKIKKREEILQLIRVMNTA